MTSIFSRDVEELSLRYFEGLGDSRALSLAILLRHGEWDAIATMRCDPKSYLTAKAYARAAASTAFLRKCSDLPTTIDREANALAKWKDGEVRCYKSNLRLASLLPEHRASEDSDSRLCEFFDRVRKRVSGWIGDRPRVLTNLKFGPGSTYSDRGIYTTIPDKMSSVPTLTHSTMYFLPQWLETAWGRHCADQGVFPQFVRGNRFALAPKDAETHRAIAIEPSVNVVYQLGLGAELRQGLRLAGVDLNNAQLVHRKVAAAASFTNLDATLDAVNASDTLCYNLVKLCMPTLWFEQLKMLRSPFTELDGKWVKLEKFSSMGNGFTFELETIIFAALCCEALASVGLPSRLGKDVYVYGDDMIVPRDGVREVTAVLAYSGIQLNLKKSFSDGPFRESCGGDYFAGKPVRPFSLKGVPCEPNEWIGVANGISRQTWELGSLDGFRGPDAIWSREARPDGFSPRGEILRRAWYFCLDRMPTVVSRCRGPQGLGDIVINDCKTRWETKTRWSIRQVRVYKPARHRKVPYILFHPDVVLACASYGLGWGDGGVTPRDSVLGHKVGWVPYS